MGSKTRLGSYCTKRANNGVNLVTSRKINTRLARLIAGEVSLLDDVTPIFYRTEVSAHGPIICRKQLREKIGAILYRNKSQRTRTDFHSDFLSTIKNRSVCAWH